MLLRRSLTTAGRRKRSLVPSRGRSFSTETYQWKDNILSLSSTATTLRGVVDEVDTAHTESNKPPAAFLTVHIHQLEQFQGPSWVDKQDAPYPILGVTAERNIYLDFAEEMDDEDGDDDEEEEDMQNAGIDDIINRRRRRSLQAHARRSKRTANITASTAAAAAEDNKKKSTATIISIGFPPEKKVQAIPFIATDASFPEIPGKSIQEMLTTSSGQPLILVFAQSSFPLMEFTTRLEMLFNKRSIIAAYSRSVSDQKSRIFALPSPSSSSSSSSFHPAAVGMAIFGDVSQQEIGKIAVSILGSNWLGDFGLYTALTGHLFVPDNLTLGKQHPQHLSLLSRTTYHARPASLSIW